ncbi:hypothetical protein [Lentzea sp.]
MTLHLADDLFSHLESHQPQASEGASHAAQPTWTNLFQEPPAVPAASAEQ